MIVHSSKQGWLVAALGLSLACACNRQHVRPDDQASASAAPMAKEPGVGCPPLVREREPYRDAAISAAVSGSSAKIRASIRAR